MIDMITTSSTMSLSSCQPLSHRKNTIHHPSIRPLPNILIDFFALTMGDLLPVRYSPRGHRTAPELLYFIHKVTSQARISCHIAVVALIYIERCKEALPRHAVGNQDTAHRIIVASLLIASKFLHGTRWATCQQQPPKENSNSQDEDEDEEVDLRLCADEDKPCWLTNCRMAGICGMYSLEQVNQLERSFLNLIQHRCWVDAGEVQAYLIRHRQDLLL